MSSARGRGGLSSDHHSIVQPVHSILMKRDIIEGARLRFSCIHMGTFPKSFNTRIDFVLLPAIIQIRSWKAVINMAVSYQILGNKRLVIITTSGEITINETIQSLERMFSDPTYVPEYDVLWDDRERTSIFTYDDMRLMLQHFKHYRGKKHPKRAIVISRVDHYGMTRVFTTMMSMNSQTQIGLFSDINEARKWLEQ
jgi:hypothetical protein